MDWENFIVSKRAFSLLLDIYKYLMSSLTLVCFLVVPLTNQHQYFDSLVLDGLVRCFLSLYLVFCYWTVVANLKHRMNNTHSLFEMRNVSLQKNVVSFAMLAISAVGLGALLFWLTQWSLGTYVPQFSAGLRFILSLGNGIVFGALGLLQYVFLPDD
jgi:hypothetical protein